MTIDCDVTSPYEYSPTGSMPQKGVWHPLRLVSVQIIIQPMKTGPALGQYNGTTGMTVKLQGEYSSLLERNTTPAFI